MFGNFKYMSDGSLVANGHTLTQQEMQAISDQYRGVNRIHKPSGLLFWTDCKNGNSNNWITN